MSYRSYPRLAPLRHVLILSLQPYSEKQKNLIRSITPIIARSQNKKTGSIVNLAFLCDPFTVFPVIIWIDGRIGILH